MQSDPRLSFLEPCAPEPASVAAAPLRHGAGSLAEGDKREFIAASALSKRITELERVLRMPLLLRQARGVESTAAGRVLVLGAKTLLQKAIDLEVNVRDFATRGHQATCGWLQTSLRSHNSSRLISAISRRATHAPRSIWRSASVQA